MSGRTLRFEAVNLPGITRCENYLPAALPALQRRCGQAFLPVIAAPGEPIEKLPAADAADPEAMDALAQRMGGTFAFGPVCAGGGTIRLPNATPRDPHKTATGAVIGLIDTGIAFWNPRFLLDRGPQFDGIAFLDLDSDGAAPVCKTIGQSEIVAFCKQGGWPNGDEQVRAALAARFPHSIYGAQDDGGPLLQPGEMSHGTAMADLAGRFDPARPETAPRLFGLELPRAALLDSTGNSLEFLIEPAIRGLVAMIEAAHEETGRPDIVIALPFGFPGGPHDGSRTSARQLGELMADDAFAHVHLVLPMGNHRQDRCHARLDDLSPHTDSAPLTWFLEPFDHSANTLDLLYRGAAPQLTLTAPDGRIATHPLADAPLAKLIDAGATIGAAWDRQSAEDGGWHRLRITLGATHPAGQGWATAPSGAWSIRLRAAEAGLTDLNAWILRDEWPGRGAKAAQHLQSRFDDPLYRALGEHGTIPLDDGPGDSMIRRAGTASVLTTAIGTRIVCVGARERLYRDGPEQVAAYSGLPHDGVDPAECELVDDPGPFMGQSAIGNGGPREFRVSGTSVAAALRAGRIAAAINAP